MQLDWIAISLTLFAGISTAIGALPIFLKKEFSRESLDVGMGFSAGIMLVASFLSLLVPGLAESRVIFGDQWGLWPVLLGLFLGYLSIIFIHDFIPHEHLYKDTDMGHKNSLSRTTLIILAIALHNIPEGLAVGVGFGQGSQASGNLLAVAIALQNMPEGLVVALGLLREGSSRRRAFVMALCSGLVEPVAALFGYLSTRIIHFALPVALGFAAGAMLFVICQEMFPELFKKGHERRTTLGVISGIALMVALDYLFV